MRAAVLAVAFVLPLHAAVLGISKPAESLTEARVMHLPPGERVLWLDYLHRSSAQETQDRAGIAREREGMTVIPPLPRQSNSARSIPLHREAAFYASEEARHIGDVILSFQTPAGGWSKNLDMSGPPRAKGQSYATGNLAPVASPAGDFDAARDEHWHYVGTLDNDATNSELHFLASLSAALPSAEGDKYRGSFLRGVEYLLHAQFPNGGWPQVWPLEGGYHDAITFNDDAVTEAAELLSEVADRKPAGVEDYRFVPAALSQRAAAAVKKALDCILATQVRMTAADSKGALLTVWAQQHDALTLLPVSGRNFEPAALSSGESASILEYLMSLPRPTPAVVRAVEAAAAWLRAHQIDGYAWSGGRASEGGRKLTPQPGAGPLWARYYSLTTGKPIFGDRDKTIHDDVMEISVERRNGYAWYGSGPRAALEQYAAWNEARADGCFEAAPADKSVRKDPPCKR